VFALGLTPDVERERERKSARQIEANKTHTDSTVFPRASQKHR
jgi:hypothetical protein